MGRNRRRYNKKKYWHASSSGESTASDASTTASVTTASSKRDRDLLKQYLKEYQDCMHEHYRLAHNKDAANQEVSLMKSPEPIVVFGVEFPRFEGEMLDQPYLALPTALTNKDRRQVHELCEEVGLFHCGCTIQKCGSDERFVALSIFHDGLSHVPGIEEENPNAQQQCLQEFKPWVRQKNASEKDRALKEAKRRIYKLVDQPGECLRDDVDEFDVAAMAQEDLRGTTPPKTGDGNWLWVNSQETMNQCVQELSENKPKELAFDLECLNKSKTAQLTCLIQLATDDGREYVIDVLADGVWNHVNKLAPLFADKNIVKIGHGINGVDTPSLYRDFGIVVVNVFDTLEAAKVLRLKHKGLAKVCSYYGLPNCEVYDELKAEYQMTDWTRRPLTELMVLYGRYDVHYLVQLRMLMIRDLINISGGVKESDAIEDAQNLQAMIQAMNAEDDIDDDYALDQVDLPDDNELQNPEGCSTDATATMYTVKELRMNLELMRAISSSQNKCLSLWSDQPTKHRSDAGYLKIVSKDKMEGLEWTQSQSHLYDSLAQWREEVAMRHRILPGFVCGLDFLAKVARTRPISKTGMQQITYHLPHLLLQNNEKELHSVLAFVHASRAEDNLTDHVAYPSFQESKDLHTNDAMKKKMYLIGLVAAFSAIAIMVKGRSRVRRACSSTFRKRHSLFACLLLTGRLQYAASLTVPPNGCPDTERLRMSDDMTRRTFGMGAFQTGAASLAGFAAPYAVPSVANAAPVGGRLAERLSQKDPALLQNSVFNLPPPAQVYPQFMRGTWNVSLKYAGYLFPSQKIERSRLTADAQVPGFQKCSIAALSDVGKETVQYTMSIDPGTGLEDRIKTLTTSIDDHLGYSAIQQVLYNPKANPNRLSLVFVEYRTTNAERIELFCNGRESELIDRTEESGSKRQIFVCSEFIRQVTFGTGSKVGVPRQVGTNYAHFWTWKETLGNSDTLTGNLLTAAYLDPQDALFFEEPSKPVAVFSHVITANRIG